MLGRKHWLFAGSEAAAHRTAILCSLVQTCKHLQILASPDRWASAVEVLRRPTYGTQEGTAYNGHFACTCYHPLLVFNQHGDLERCALHPGQRP